MTKTELMKLSKAELVKLVMKLKKEDDKFIFMLNYDTYEECLECNSMEELVEKMSEEVMEGSLTEDNINNGVVLVGRAAKSVKIVPAKVSIEF